MYQLARATGEEYTRVLYIYIHKQKPIGWFSRPETPRHPDTEELLRRKGTIFSAKRQKTRSFLSVHNVPIRAQATPDRDGRDGPKLSQTDLNRPKPDPGPLWKPRLATWCTLASLAIAHLCSLSPFNLPIPSSPPLLLLSPCSSPASERKDPAPLPPSPHIIPYPLSHRAQQV